MPRSSTARARLVDSARPLIHARNYAAASIDELCADASVRKGTFYDYVQRALLDGASPSDVIADVGEPVLAGMFE